MIHVISKLLPSFFFPVNFTIILALAAYIALLRKSGKTASWLILAAAANLFIFSSPVVAHRLVRGLEGPYRQERSCPAQASAIVVLGGAGVPALPPRSYAETNAFGDRVLHGARLRRMGCAGHLVATGGKIGFIKDFDGSEARNNAALLEEILGDAYGSVLLAEDSRNTREDAQSVARLFEARGLPKDILLVTSAGHMRRSLALFRKQGFAAHPAPTDFHADAQARITWFNLIPNESSLYESWYALHEYLGYAAYDMLGWI